MGLNTHSRTIFTFPPNSTITVQEHHPKPKQVKVSVDLEPKLIAMLILVILLYRLAVNQPPLAATITTKFGGWLFYSILTRKMTDNL